MQWSVVLLIVIDRGGSSGGFEYGPQPPNNNVASVARNATHALEVLQVGTQDGNLAVASCQLDAVFVLEIDEITIALLRSGLRLHCQILRCSQLARQISGVAGGQEKQYSHDASNSDPDATSHKLHRSWITSVRPGRSSAHAGRTQ